MGKWFVEYSEPENDPDKRDYLEFFSDNTYAIKDSSKFSKGKWAILDDGRLKIEAPEGIKAYKVKIEGDEMQLLNERGGGPKLTRAK